MSLIKHDSSDGATKNKTKQNVVRYLEESLLTAQEGLN
jgi:hypothetical protein